MEDTQLALKMVASISTLLSPRRCFLPLFLHSNTWCPFTLWWLVNTHQHFRQYWSPVLHSYNLLRQKFPAALSLFSYNSFSHNSPSFLLITSCRISKNRCSTKLTLWHIHIFYLGLTVIQMFRQYSTVRTYASDSDSQISQIVYLALLYNCFFQQGKIIVLFSARCR